MHKGQADIKCWRKFYSGEIWTLSWSKWKAVRNLSINQWIWTNKCAYKHLGLDPALLKFIYFFCFFNWRITTSQCFINFFCTTTQISHNSVFVCVCVCVSSPSWTRRPCKIMQILLPISSRDMDRNFLFLTSPLINYILQGRGSEAWM